MAGEFKNRALVATVCSLKSVLDRCGSAFDTIKVYIDCYRGAAAVSAGLLPGAVCVFDIALAHP